MTKEEYIAAKKKAAREAFKSGLNCSQAVALAFSEELGLEPEKIIRLTVGFGGGMGRMREVCGAFSGAVLVSSVAVGGTGDLRSESYALVQAMAAEFKAEAGSIICGELLGLRGGAEPMSHEPQPRTEAYYKKRPCVEMVALAAGIVAEKIFNAL